MEMEFIHKKAHDKNSFLAEAFRSVPSWTLILIHLNFTCSEVSNKIPPNRFQIRESPGLAYGCSSLVFEGMGSACWSDVLIPALMWLLHSQAWKGIFSFAFFCLFLEVTRNSWKLQKLWVGESGHLAACSWAAAKKRCHPNLYVHSKQLWKVLEHFRSLKNDQLGHFGWCQWLVPSRAVGFVPTIWELPH